MNDTGEMRIVLITGDNAEHRYLANHLTRQVPLAAIVVDRGRPTRSSERLRRIWKRYTLVQLVGRGCMLLLRRIWGVRRRRAERLRSVFGAEHQEFHHQELVRTVNGINTPEAMSLVKECRPDVLLVFGTGIVSDKVLALARQIALNVHTGISPHYRGAECTFWPLHNEEPGMLGATVHECTRKVDGGKIFATGHARLEADDCQFSAFARCVLVAADLYVLVVKQIMAGEAVGTPQDLSVGTEYKAADHGLRAELRVRHLIRSGLIRRYVEVRRGLDSGEARVSG